METVMVKNEKKLLKRLIKAATQYTDQSIPISEINSGFDNYYLQRLLNKKLVFKHAHQEDEEGNMIFDSVVISNEGTHYFEINKEELKHFFLRSIATPIVVSAITTLVTLFLTWLAKMVVG